MSGFDAVARVLETAYRAEFQTEVGRTNYRCHLGAILAFIAILSFSGVERIVAIVRGSKFNEHLDIVQLFIILLISGFLCVVGVTLYEWLCRKHPK